MAKNLKPQVGITSVFNIKEPINEIIRNDIKYKVTAVRTIRDYINDSIDVKTLIYIDQGLSNVEYENSLNNNLSIVTLTDSNDKVFYIPEDFFISIPDITGVEYVQKTIVVNMRIVKKDMPMDFITNEIADLVELNLGIKPDIEIMETSQTMIYSREESDVFETTRLANKTNNKTCVTKLAEVNNILIAMRDKEKILVDRLVQLES